VIYVFTGLLVKWIEKEIIQNKNVLHTWALKSNDSIYWLKITLEYHQRSR